MSEQNPPDPENSERGEIVSTSIEFESEGFKLTGLLYQAGEQTPGVLILRGGANIHHQQAGNQEWQAAMAQAGISSLSFDFRGVGDSEGDLAETSLDTRLEDSRAAASTLAVKAKTAGLFVAGVSMGAPTAISLAQELNVEGLILISPAAYSEEAHHQNFGPAFSEAIRKPDSWQGSPDFAALQSYTGKVALAYAENDTIIPRPILDQYAEIVGSKGKVLAFDTSHSFIRLEDPASLAARQATYNAIAELTKKD